VAKEFEMHIGKDVHPAAQSGSRRIAGFGFWGEIAGTALASVKAVLTIQSHRLRRPKRLQNQHFRDYGGS
jgi:hypothetical protein